MSKSTPLSISPDQFSLITTILVLVLSVSYITPIIPLTEVIITSTMAFLAFASSIYYFYRVRQLEQTVATPFSDTLVVLGGVFLGISFTFNAIQGSFLSYWWSLGLIGLGVVGRLILLDSILKSLINGIGRLFSNTYQWITANVVLFLRLLVAGVGIFLIVVPSVRTLIPQATAIGYGVITVDLAIGVVQGEQPNVLLRLGSGVLLINSLLSLLDQPGIIASTAMIAFMSMVVIWNLGYDRFRSLLNWFNQLMHRLGHIFVHTAKISVQYLRQYPLRVVRGLLVLSGLVLGLFGLFYDLRLSLLGGGLIIIAYIQPLLQTMHRVLTSILEEFREHPQRSIQITAFILAVPAYLLLPGQYQINIVATSVLITIGIGPTIFPVVWDIMTSVLTTIGDYLTKLGRFFRQQPVRALRVLAGVLVIPAWVFIPATMIWRGVSSNILVSSLLLATAIGPTLVRAVYSVMPALVSMVTRIGKFLQSVGLYLYDKFLSFNTYMWLLSIGGMYGLFTTPRSLPYVRIIFATMVVIGLSFMGDKYLMRLYDRITRTFTRIATPLVKLARFFIPDISMGRVLSVLAWFMLFLSIFGFILPASLPNPGRIRLLLFVGSIVLWNAAYPVRRERFVRFVNRVTQGLISRLYRFAIWVLRNIYLIGLVLLGIAFIVIAIGILLPGTSQFVVTLFGDILDNRLVSWIIGLFLIAMGVFTWQQAFARRVDLRLDVEGGNQE